MKLCELLTISHGYVKALSGRSGKVVFDTYRNKEEYVKRFEDCEVISVWMEVCSGEVCGFTQAVTQKLCLHLHGPDVERALMNEEVD